MNTDLSKRLSVALFAISTVGLAAPSHAAWYVYAEATTQAYIGGGQDYHSGNIRTCNGTSSNCSPPVQGAGADPITYTHSDTATSSLAQANIMSIYQGTPSQGTASAQSNAYAFGDLATGEMKISNSGVMNNSSALYGYSSHGSEVILSDILHFQSTLSGPVTATVVLHLDGSFLGFEQPTFSFQLSNYTSSMSLTQQWSDPYASTPVCVGEVAGCTVATNRDITTNGNWTKLNEGDYVGTFIFDPGHPDYTIGMSLQAGGSGTSFAAFEHTASVRFNLPSGMSFTSDSGTFLSAATSAIPEPATWATMLAGFGMIGAALRRRGRLPALA